MIKKLLLAVAIVGAATYSQAQGYVNFNSNTEGVSAKIYDVDGKTALTGNGYYAQIYAADGPVTDDTKLTAKGTPVNFSTSAANAGYVRTGGTTTWDGSDVNPKVTVTDSTAYTTVVTIQVRAWSADTTSTTYDTASKSGKSTLFQVTAKASTGSDGLGQTPDNLVGFTSFNLTPEPTTIALGALGLSVLLFRRRK